MNQGEALSGLMLTVPRKIIRAQSFAPTVFGFPGEQTFCDNFCIFTEICLRNPVSGGEMG